MNRFRTTRLTVVGVAILLGLSGCAMDPEVSESMKYDPELYKEHIQPIEEIATKEQAERGDGVAVYKHAAELAAAMGKNIENFRVRETIQNRLINFGEYFSQQEEKGGDVEIGEIRSMWKAVRKDLFRDANWFKKL